MEQAPEELARQTPKHILFNPDGNNRWSQKHGKTYTETIGWTYGEQLRNVVDFCAEIGTKITSWGALSVNNIRYRESDKMHAVFMTVIQSARLLARKGGYQVLWTGDRTVVPVWFATQMIELENETESAGDNIVNFLIAYSGKHEIAGAIRGVANDLSTGRLRNSHISATLSAFDLENRLAHPRLPPWDLFVTPVGKQRLLACNHIAMSSTEFLQTERQIQDWTIDDLREVVSRFQNPQASTTMQSDIERWPVESLKYDEPRHVAIKMNLMSEFSTNKSKAAMTESIRLLTAETIPLLTECCHKRSVKFVSYIISPRTRYKSLSQEELVFLYGEIGKLMRLMAMYGRYRVRFLDQSNVNSGTTYTKPPLGFLEVCNNVERGTAKIVDLTVNIAIDYDSRADIVYAARKALSTVRDFKISEAMTLHDLGRSQSILNRPDVDLVIFTEGNRNMASVPLWGLDYCELFFSKSSAAALTAEYLNAIIDDYQTRKRTYGID